MCLDWQCYLVSPGPAVVKLTLYICKHQIILFGGVSQEFVTDWLSRNKISVKTENTTNNTSWPI